MVHGCTLADRAFVGLKATVMNGCRIGSDAMLAAGALLTEHKEIPSRELWAGAPARRVRETADAQAAGLPAGVPPSVPHRRIPKARQSVPSGKHATPRCHPRGPTYPPPKHTTPPHPTHTP